MMRAFFIFVLFFVPPFALAESFDQTFNRAKAIQVGASESEITRVMGAPSRIFRDPNSSKTFLLFCQIKTFSGMQKIGFWVTEDAGYFQLMRHLKGDFPAWLRRTSTVSLNCRKDLEVVWPITPNPSTASIAVSHKSKEKWNKEVYNIDLLTIQTQERNTGCLKGSEVIVTLSGMIGPDSSFAMDKLLKKLSPCRDSDGNVIKQVKLNISSGGGLLNDGYKLGKTLKKYNVRAVIKNDTSCASSCAVAFLGAADRVVEDKGQIMFHAPYFSGKNEYGERDIDCDVGDEALSELNDYYISMTDTETGDRLFERTMWYCSASDGWVVTGGAAAELYGIATER